ncbi:MAG: hypothetical protein ACHREM_03270, partial [Polyangiales bacterium]
MRTLQALAVAGIGFVCSALGACSIDGTIGGVPGEGAHGGDAATAIDAGVGATNDAPAAPVDAHVDDAPLPVADAQLPIVDTGST